MEDCLWPFLLKIDLLSEYTQDLYFVYYVYIDFTYFTSYMNITCWVMFGDGEPK